MRDPTEEDVRRPEDERVVEPGPLGDLPRILVTAEEGFPVLEQLFLEARSHVRMGFRHFDPGTPLYSAAGRAVGRDWVDLIVHTLRRGVTIELALADFDPIVAAEMHRQTWQAMRLFAAARELAAAEGATGTLTVISATHPARIAPLPRVALWAAVRLEMNERMRNLKDEARHVRDRALAEMPGLAEWIWDHKKGSLRAKLWPLPELAPVTHHQKMAAFDSERLYIGGLDLNRRRFDTKDHDRPGPQTWHDVQVVMEGRAARDAHEHLGRFLDEVAGRQPPAPSAGAILRTLSRARSNRLAEALAMSPHTLVNELGEAHYRGVDGARRFIYLESQFFRDRELARRLAAAARANPSLTAILILPAAPEEVAFLGRGKIDMRFGEGLQAHCLRKVHRAFGPRIAVIAPARPARGRPLEGGLGRDVHFGAPIIYVHSKVAAFDDDLLLVSSANLNGRSFRWDTEAGVAFRDGPTVRRFRERLMRHWLPEGTRPEYLAPQTAAGAWARLAAANARVAPEKRQGFVLPFDIRKAEQFGAELPGIPEEMV